MSPTSPTFPALDTMRAVGASCVLLTHVAFWSGDYTAHGYFGVLLARADIGVALFFVLSGFLLSRPWLTAARFEGPAPRLGRYFWKRFLRIFPIYVVTVVLALSLISDNSDLGARDWLRTLFMLDIFVRPRLPAGLTQMWSLATEVTFYLVLPALMFLLTVLPRRGRGLRPLQVLAGVAAMFIVMIGWHLSWASQVPQAAERAPLQWLPATLGWFGLGIALALYYEVQQSNTPPCRVRRAVAHLVASPGVCWVLALGILLVAATPLAGPTMLTAPTANESLVKALLYGFCAALVILPGVTTSPQGLYGAVMSFPMLRHLGHISYGFFCLHLPILHFAMWVTGYELFQGHFWQLLGLTSALSLAAAELAYRLVEEPSMRLRNVGRRRTEAPITPPKASKVG